MKKKLLRMGLVLLFVCTCLIGAANAAADEQTVTLTVNGSGAISQTLQAEQNVFLVIRAPGATGVRLWVPDENRWEYFDHYQNLEYLERRWRYGSGTKRIYAEARYDDYGDDIWVGDESDEDQWTASSSTIRLSLTAPNGNFPSPSVSLSAGSVRRGGWLTASVTNAPGEGEWYWAELLRVLDDGSGETEHAGHFDFNGDNVLALSTAGLEPGSYRLQVSGTNVGYNPADTWKNFTVTAGQAPGASLLVSKEGAAAGEDIFVCAYVPGADSMNLQIIRRGNPTWNPERRDWHEDFVQERWNAGDPGIYDLTLTAWIDGEETEIGTQSVTLTAAEGASRLTKPDLSDFAGLLSGNEDLSGTVAVDERADSMDLDLQYAPENGDWVQLYHSYREKTDGSGWTSVSLPADLFWREGLYMLRADCHAYGIPGEGAECRILRTDTLPDAGSISLSINGSGDEFQVWESGVHLKASVAAPGATAVRLLRDNSWDYRDCRNGHAIWDMGFGEGDYTIVAQMTTDEPVWREDGFDWDGFDWEELNWTAVSNVIRIHSHSPNGCLDQPEVTVTPASGEVIRGECLKVNAISQGHNEWLWADVIAVRNDDPDNYEWENVDHYDGDGGSLAVTVPTFSLDPGDYYLKVGMDAQGWTSSEVYLPFTVLENPDMPEVSLLLSRDSMQANEDVRIYAYAPEASYMILDIDWDRDPFWDESRSGPGEYNVWDWGCGCGGQYTFTLTAVFFRENGEEKVQVTRELTVTSDGELDAPVISGIPGVLSVGEAVSGSFGAVEGAEWYSVELQYAPDDEPWDQLYYDNRDPSGENAAQLAFDGSFFAVPGRYRLSVNAAAAGVDNGYTEYWILVLENAEPDDTFIMKIDDTADEGSLGEFLLYQNVKISFEAPSDVTGIRVWYGKGWDCFDRGADTAYYNNYSAYEEGPITFVAQATTDPAIMEWKEENDGDLDGFDWNEVTWSLTSNYMTIEVVCLGNLGAPVIHMPSNPVMRGDWLEASFDPVTNAYSIGVWIESIPAAEDEWSETVFDAEYFEGDTIIVPTDALKPGAYVLRAESRRYGWRGGNSRYFFTVAEPADYADEPVFRVRTTEVWTNEDFAVSVYAPGAEEVLFCHEEPDNCWRQESGERISTVIRCDRPGEYVFRAYASYEDEEELVQIGDDQIVTVTAPNGSLEGILDAPALAAADQDYTFSFTWMHGGRWMQNGGIYVYDENWNEMLSILGGDASMDVQDMDDRTVITFTIAAGALQPGSYRIEAGFCPEDRGYDWTEAAKMFMVVEDASDAIITNIKSEYLSQEHPYVMIYAPDAVRVTAWISRSWPVDLSEEYWASAEGDTLVKDVTFGTSEGMRYVEIHAEYEDGRTEVKEIAITLTAPYGDLPSPRIWMNSVWTEGQNLHFRVDPPCGSAFIISRIEDEAGNIVFEDEGLNFDYWAYDLPESWFEPGHTYTLWVYTTEVGYNENETGFPLRMLPSGAGVFTLPAGLTEIEPEAFEGIAAQKLVIPDSVTDVASRAFAGCDNLVVAELPADTSGFVDDAFEGSGPVMVYGYEDSGAEAYAARSDDISFIYLDS